MTFLRDLQASIRAREFWTYSGLLDVAVRYRKNRLGLAWLVIPPAAFIIVLGFVYSALMGYEAARFLPYMGVGYALWRSIMQVVTESPGLFRANKAFVLDGRIRYTDYLLRMLWKVALYLSPALGVALTLQAYYSGLPIRGLLLLVPLLLVFFCNLLWIGAVLAILGARHPDIGEFINTLLILGFLLTPILWYPEHAPAGSLHGWLMRLNPAFHLIGVVRAPLIGETLELSEVGVVFGLWVVGWLFASWLYRRFNRFIPIWI